MLREFAAWLEPGTVLLSYNGKCYDRPLLSTRYTLARLPDPVLGREHIDLLHPVRRRYRGVWENCRLATVERHLLGVVREDDLPGSQAPAAWLSYLRGGSAERLRKVADHNARDLRSLCGLLVHFHALAQGGPPLPPPPRPPPPPAPPPLPRLCGLLAPFPALAQGAPPLPPVPR